MQILQSLTVAGVSLCSAVAMAQQPVVADWNVREHLKPAEIIVQSHRGAGVLAEENTIQSFELGWKLNTIPESDVRTTSDGVIVAFHDANFKRVVKDAPSELQNKGVKDLTFEQLKTLDVGSWMGDDFKGRRVNTMDEIFAVMAGRPDRHLYMDIKDVDFKNLAELVKKHKVGPQVILASPSQEKILEWKSLVPDSKTLLWIGGKTGEEQIRKFEDAKARDFNGVTQVQIHTNIKPDQDVNAVTPRSVDPFTVSDAFLVEAGDTLRAKDILFQTLPWGASSRDVYWKLLDLGLMSFASDHPDVTRKAIEDYYKQKPSTAKTDVKQDPN